VFIVSTDVPVVPVTVMDDGLKPALAIPVGNPLSLLTDRLTIPLNPLFGEMLTVNVVD